MVGCGCAAVTCQLALARTRAKAHRPLPSAGPPAEPPPPVVRKRDAALALLAFAVLFIALEVNGYTRTSATWDEPMHLTSGYAALAYQDYRVDPTHPPFVRMWAALPSWLAGDSFMDRATIDKASVPEWYSDAYAFARQFLYVDNDADRLLYAARFMIVLLGVLLGVFLFCWVHEWLGFLPAVCALVLYTLEPNIAAHSTLVTTDLGVTCFMFGAVYFLWRACRRRTTLNVAGLGLCCALAMVTKFSAVLLAPIVLLLLAYAVWRRMMPARSAAGIAIVVAAATFVTIWAAYGLRHDASASRTWSYHLESTEMALSAPRLAGLVGWIDAHQLLPNAFTEGILLSQTTTLEIGAFMAGEVSQEGWWYYFPFAFLIKTPIGLILLIGIGIFAGLKGRKGDRVSVVPFIAVPVTVYMAVAMMGQINIGLRHILPVYPFALLVAVSAIARLAAMSRAGRTVAVTLVVVALAEFASSYPDSLAFFNQLVGGPNNGFRYLADSNLGWGQNLKPLKRWMGQRGVSHVNLAYFGQADPAYYMIDCTYLPGSSTFALDSIARPQLPGYVAISGTVLSGVYLAPQWRLFYSGFRDLTPAAVIGNSLRVYWIEEWPEPPARDALIADPASYRVLGDALLFGLQWPEPALAHYRTYLERHPGEAGVLVNAGLALVAEGREEEAVRTFHEAVDAAPENGIARLTLARALFGAGDLGGADVHAQRAVTLRPFDPATYELLGRVRAVQGQFDEARRLFRRALEIDPTYLKAREALHPLER